jgi:ankyrin repeat protein
MNHFIKAIYLVLVFMVSSAHAGAFEDFFRAVRTNNAGGVDDLLARGFDPNSHEESGQSALTLAVREDARQVVEVLLKNPQLAVDRPNQFGETGLMFAALKGDLALARRLVERGAAINRPGWNPLHYAASGPEPELVAWLLMRGAELEARSPNGTTALMMAARYGNEQSADLLLAQHASTEVRNDRGLNAADFARAGGREALAKRLESRLR